MDKVIFKIKEKDKDLAEKILNEHDFKGKWDDDCLIVAKTSQDYIYDILDDAGVDFFVAS